MSNTMTPITNAGQVRKVLIEAKKMGQRQYLLMKIGFYTGLRISDILRLRARDITDKGIRIREKKTGKQQRIEIHPAEYLDIQKLTASMQEEELLFPSPHLARRNEPIEYATAFQWVKRACRNAGITEPVGCHTMRKTYGYIYYRESGGNVALLMRRFNHANQEETLRYIGVLDEKVNEISRKVRYQ